MAESHLRQRTGEDSEGVIIMVHVPFTLFWLVLGPALVVRLFWLVFIPILIGATIAVWRAYRSERRKAQFEQAIFWNGRDECRIRKIQDMPRPVRARSMK